jgi:hypothetical protein
MPVKIKKVGAVARRSKKRKPLREEPQLGILPARILKMMDVLGNEASGHKVLEGLMVKKTGEWLNPSLVYGIIRKLANKQQQFLKYVGTRRSPLGGPPLKIYRVTAAGRTAIKVTAAYHRGVVEELER